MAFDIIKTLRALALPILNQAGHDPDGEDTETDENSGRALIRNGDGNGAGDEGDE